MAKQVERLKKQMLKHAENLEFEDAARLRDEINKLENARLGGRVPQTGAVSSSKKA